MSPDEFEKAREAEAETLTDHWVVIWDANCLDDTSTTEASLVHDCTPQTDEQGNLWLMRGDKPLGVYADGQWRKCARLVIRRFAGGELVEMPVDNKDGGASA